MLSSGKIGIFDSGVGGLTVAKAIRSLLPHEEIAYFGDSVHLPYGNKSEENILQYSEDNVEFLLKQNVKVIVIACNTSTAVALSFLQKKYSIPILGVVEPGALEAVVKSKYQKIGVIGTFRTIVSNAYRDAILAANPKAKVKQKACPLLVPIIEEGFKNKLVIDGVIDTYLSDLVKEVDSVVLGCTHYPLMKAHMKRIYPKVQFIDSATATARALKKELSEKQLLRNLGEGCIKIFTNDQNEIFNKIAKKLFPREQTLLIRET